MVDLPTVHNDAEVARHGGPTTGRPHASFAGSVEDRPAADEGRRRPAAADGTRSPRWTRAAVGQATARLLGNARSQAARLAHEASERWHRSLQLRVAATTMLASGLVVVVLGVLLLNVFTAGLLDAKRKAAHAEANNGLRIARTQLSVVTEAEGDNLIRALDALTGGLASRGAQAGLFYVVVLPAGDVPQAISSGNVDAESIPGGLRRLVRAGNLADAYAPIQLQGGNAVKGLVVGAPVSGPSGSFELYYLFPLEDEERTIALVRRAVLVTGFLLVVLVAGIAVLVTRQVVRPVRVAAKTAERFAAGRLEERMQVHGKDDLALLASAFNDMADSLQRQISKLEALSRLQRRFTSDVSHELRTPLTTVRMAADVLHAARDGFPREVSRSAELLQAELDRFESLLADLLEISRYDAHVAVLEAEPVDLRGLVRRVVDTTSAIAERQGSVIHVDLPAEPVVADVDTRRVERILRNLLVNAVEHGEGRPVEVYLQGDPTAVAITVRDHGIGLRPGEAALVFDRFWRADLSRDRRTGGTGLGLAISIEDARLHGGWLHAWGRPGQGAQFRLTLPVHGGDVLVSSPLPIEPPDALPSRARISPTGPVAGTTITRAGREGLAPRAQVAHPPAAASRVADRAEEPS
jgi:two-component system, OmpR family, sensor histidine kinase MtrB